MGEEGRADPAYKVLPEFGCPLLTRTEVLWSSGIELKAFTRLYVHDSPMGRTSPKIVHVQMAAWAEVDVPVDVVPLLRSAFGAPRQTQRGNTHRQSQGAEAQGKQAEDVHAQKLPSTADNPANPP